MGKKRTRGNPYPLIIEPHPADYDGIPFITLIQFRSSNDTKHFLTVVDNADTSVIKSYVLDLCSPAGVDEERIINVASYWYDNNRERYPVSFEFSRQGLASEVEPIYRTFSIEFVTRVIGPLPKFEMGEVKQVRRRRRKPVPAGMEIQRKVLDLSS